MQHLELRVVFPKTIEILGERSLQHLASEFFDDLKDQLGSVLQSNDSRWFPAYLKLRGLSDEILEVAEFEYLRYLVRTQDFGYPRIESGILKINPSIQFIHIKRSQPKIQRDVGLYCFFRLGSSFIELQLDLDQALVIDLMQEERKYNFQQLVRMSVLNQVGIQKTESQWADVIRRLIDVGILIDPDTEVQTFKNN